MCVGVSLVWPTFSSYCIKMVLWVCHLFLSGTPSVMWSLVEFTWYWNGLQQPQSQTDWTRSVFPDKSGPLLIGLIHTHLFFPMSSGSSVPLQTVLPEQGCFLSRPTVCLYRAGRWLTSESFVASVTDDVGIIWRRQCVQYMSIIIAFPVSLQVKKSGKEPKVGAEVTLGKMSRKTTVRPQTSFSLILIILCVKVLLH